jgi:succinyl-diaminopimelate desuccinylase
MFSCFSRSGEIFPMISRKGSSEVDALSILKELISIPSVNPMGRDVHGPEFLETRLTEYLIEFFNGLGVESQKIEVAAGRDNVIARCDQPRSKTTILMDAHQDTVPVDGMTIEPFTPVEKEGRLYGRGACDVKGGMAAMLAAFARLVKEQPGDAANVVVSCSCDEEATVMGIRDLVKLWSSPQPEGTLLTVAPDVAVVAEPTDLDIVVAHRGATRWKIRTTGRACHSSRPDEGVNAIYRMAEVLKSLESYAGRLADEIPHHPLCGPATLSVGLIAGGISVNTVPDVCEIEIDRRVIPGEDGNEVMNHVAAELRNSLDFEVEFLPPWITGTPLCDDNNGEWADRLMSSIEDVTSTPHRKVGVAYGTNASRIAATGVPSIVFGPGSIDQAHTKDEWIAIDELEQACEIYYHFCASNG